MREQGAVNNPKMPQLATMTSEKSCDIGDLELEHDDLLMAAHLVGKLTSGDIVLVQRLNEKKYAVIERLVEV